MESHHPHHITHKKNWGEYLLEFFMLFLAVFLGFLAENQREHIVEHNREKQFMVSFIKDLELDTAQLQNIRGFRLNRIKNIDSVFSYFNSHSSDIIPVKNYIRIQQIFGHTGFYQNSGTIDQLKNSGGLRLIRKRNIVDSIEAYDQQIKRMVLRDRYETDWLVHNVQIAEKMFDGRVLLKLRSETSFGNPAGPEVAIPINTQYLGEYLNSLYTYLRIAESDLDLQVTIQRKAGNLIKSIKEEYHLE